MRDYGTATDDGLAVTTRRQPGIRVTLQCDAHGDVTWDIQTASVGSHFLKWVRVRNGRVRGVGVPADAWDLVLTLKAVLDGVAHEQRLF